MKTLNLKWKMRNLNKELGITGNGITKTKIANYLKRYPKTTDFVKQILNNIELTPKELAKLTGKPLGVVNRFYKASIESVLHNEPRIGKEPLNIIKIVAEEKKITHKKRKVKTSKVNEAPTLFKSKGKQVVKEKLVELLLNEKSPKKGIVATLPFEFDFEKQLIKMPQLDGLNFHGFEFAYNITQGVESRKRFKKQRKILRHNPKLASRFCMFNNNINDILNKDYSERYAHIFADYCGAFSTNRKTIEHVIKNDLLVKGGLVWITLSAHDKKGGGVKTKLPELVKNIGGERYKIEEIAGEKLYRYQGSANGYAPMYVMIVRRIK